MGEPAKYPSKERVVRDSYLVYAEGDDIPETDVAELKAQGYISGPKDLQKADTAGDDKAEQPAANKSRRRGTTK